MHSIVPGPRAPKKERTQRPTASASTEEKEDEPMMTDDDMDDEFKCDDESSDDSEFPYYGFDTRRAQNIGCPSHRPHRTI